MKSFLILGIIFLFSSCAAFRSQETEQVNRIPKEVRKSEKIKTYLKYSEPVFYKNGKLDSANISKSDRTKLEKNLRHAYKEAKIFKFVSEKEADLVIQISLVGRTEDSFWMTIVSGVSLFLIPSRAIDKYELTVKFTQNGEELESFVKNETLTTWRQSFLIFALPFGTPGSVREKTLIDLNRSIITDAYFAGYLKQDPVDAALISPSLIESEGIAQESMTLLNLDDLPVY
jgi:hypothetical protein